MDKLIDNAESIEFDILRAYNDNILNKTDQRLVEEKLKNNPKLNLANKYFLKEKKVLKDLIPIKKINEETDSQLKTELNGIFKSFKEVPGNPLVSKRRKTFTLLKNINKELTGVIFSKEMVKYYMITIIMGITIKYFQS